MEPNDLSVTVKEFMALSNKIVNGNDAYQWITTNKKGSVVALLNKVREKVQTLQLLSGNKQDFDKITEQLILQLYNAIHNTNGYLNEIVNQKNTMALSNTPKALNDLIELIDRTLYSEYKLEDTTFEQGVILAHRIEQSILDTYKYKFIVEFDKTHTLFEKVKEESDEIIAAARSAADTAGVTAFEKHFLAQERRCSVRSWFWFSCMIVLLAASAAGAWYFYGHPIEDKESIVIYQCLVARVTFLAVLISAAMWCGRIFKALYHQELINNHRALSLKTMNAFLLSVHDTSARDAIIVQCTKAIFGGVPTGFINESGSDPDVNFIAVANRMMQPDK